MLQSLKILFLSNFQNFLACNKVNCCLDRRILLIEISCDIISLCIMLDYFIAGSTEYKNVIVSNEFMNLNICSILCSECYSSVQHEFHITCSTGFFRCK